MSVGAKVQQNVHHFQPVSFHRRKIYNKENVSHTLLLLLSKSYNGYIIENKRIKTQVKIKTHN